MIIIKLPKKRLLNVLVMTGKTDTKVKSFWRYIETGQHIETWHTVSKGKSILIFLLYVLVHVEQGPGVTRLKCRPCQHLATPDVIEI